MICILQLTISKRQVSHRWEVQTANIRNVENSMLSQDNSVQYWYFQYATNFVSTPAFNNGSSERNRLFCIENGILTKLRDVSLDPTKLLMQITYVGTRFNVCEWTRFRCLSLFQLERLWFYGGEGGYDSIGVHQQIRNRNFTTQITMKLTSIAS